MSNAVALACASAALSLVPHAGWSSASATARARLAASALPEGYVYDSRGRIVHEEDLPPPPPMGNPEAVLMRITFAEGTRDDVVRALIDSFPFDSLSAAQRGKVEQVAAGVRLMFQREPEADEGPAGEQVADGGLLLSVVSPDADGGRPTLDVSRVAEGSGPMPKVIREKQVSKKILRHCERSEAFESHRMKAFVTGF